MASERFIGVDPGANGALAIIDTNSKPVYWERYKGLSFPEVGAFLQKIKDFVVSAVVEQVQLWPHLSPGMVQNTQALLIQAGEWHGLFKFLGLTYRTVRPREWQAYFDLQDWQAALKTVKKRFEGREDEAHIQALLSRSPLGLARQLWPDVPMPNNAHDGIAVALLLAELARQTALAMPGAQQLKLAMPRGGKKYRRGRKR